MNQQAFQRIYNRLTDRRQQVLNRIVAGQTDKQIADSLGIGPATVRKHIERITEAFGLGEKTSQEGQRRSKRSDLVSLIAQFKPELLKTPSTRFNEFIPSHESTSVLDLLEAIQPIQSIQENLKPKLEFLKVSVEEKQKLQISQVLKKTGYQNYMEGDFQSAIFYIEWAIQFDPSPAAHYNLGSAYEKLGDFSKAYELYHLAAQSDHPATYAAISNLARLDILNNNLDKAIARINQVLDKVTEAALLSSLYKNLGWAYSLQDNYPKAEQALRESIRLNGDRAAPHCLLAQVLEAQNKLAKAVPYWQRCVECDSNQTRSEQAPWRSPELDLWQQQARQRLNINPDNPTFGDRWEREPVEISLPH